MRAHEPLAIPRTLGRWDLVLLKIVAIVNINNVPPVAVYGWQPQPSPHQGGHDRDFYDRVWQTRLRGLL